MKRTLSKLALLGMLLTGLMLATAANAGHRSSVGFTYVDRDSGFAIHLGDRGGYYYDSHYEPRYYYSDRRHRHTRYCDHRYDRGYSRYYRGDRHQRHHRYYDRHDRRYDRRYRRHH